MIEASIVGTQIGETTFPVDRSKMAELARAFGDDDPVWHDPAPAAAAGFAAVPTLPTLTVLVDHWRPGGVAAVVDAVGADLSRIPCAPVELAVGDEMPAGSFGPLTRTDFVRCAGASGDFHPLHHDEPYAQSLGMPSVFGMGLLHAGILGDHLAHWVGPENIGSFAVRFTGQVWPGDVLTFTGCVERVERVGDTTVAHLVLAVIRQSEDAAITATATAVVVN